MYLSKVLNHKNTFYFWMNSQKQLGNEGFAYKPLIKYMGNSKPWWNCSFTVIIVTIRKSGKVIIKGKYHNLV